MIIKPISPRIPNSNNVDKMVTLYLKALMYNAL